MRLPPIQLREISHDRRDLVIVLGIDIPTVERAEQLDVGDVGEEVVKDDRTFGGP